MTASHTLEEILQKAINKEKASQRFYLGLSRSMSRPPVSEAFRELYRQEQGHQRLLEQYLRGELSQGMLNRGTALDYKVAEYLEQPDISPDMELKDAFLLAANQEKLSHDFYRDLAALHPEGEAKRLFEGLASQELEHKRRVETLFTEAAFPQTDGG